MSAEDVLAVLDNMLDAAHTASELMDGCPDDDVMAESSDAISAAAVLLGSARNDVAQLLGAAKRAARLLREMAAAGFGDPTQADELCAALARCKGEQA